MKILIVGAGQVGFNIAGRLVAEGHDVVLIERDEAILNRAIEGLDIQGLRGHGARPRVLEEAGIAQADMLVAVTDSDEVNMVACLNAAILGRKDIIKIARVRDESYIDPRIFGDARVAIDLALNPEKVSADKILNLLRFPEVTEVVDFAEGRLQLLGLTIKPTSPLAGMRFFDLGDRFRDVELLIAALHRDHKVIIPRGPDVVLPGDEAYIVARTEEVDTMLQAVGVSVAPVRRVMIAGGTKIGRFIAHDLTRRGIKPKIIEPDPRLARWIAEELPEAVVLNGRPTDADLLIEENVGEMQAFIACSRDEEANVMSAMLARRLGARRALVTTNRADYQPLMKSIGIDVCISPRLVAVSSILHYIRHGRVLAVRSLGEHQDAEAMEFEAQLTSDAVDTPLRDLKLPRGALVAGIQRGDQVIIPRGDTRIQEGDHVLVVAVKSAIAQVEKMLARRVDQET